LLLVATYFASFSNGATVKIEDLLVNAGFAAGNQAVSPGDIYGCPVSWNCNTGGSPTPGFTSFNNLNSTQFTPGANGVSGGLVTPSGTSAAWSPTAISGSGGMKQSFGNLVAGTTYEWNIWVGTPKVRIDGSTPSAPADTIRLYVLGNGAELTHLDVVAPAVGQWKLVTLSYTALLGDAGKTGEAFVFLANNTPGNGKEATFTMVPTAAVPEPMTLSMMGVGLLALGLVRRQRK
jgi:hypothetical protein